MSWASILWLNTDGYVEGGIACAVSLHALTISLCAQELTFVDDIWLYVYTTERESIRRLMEFMQVLEPHMAPLNRALGLQE